MAPQVPDKVAPLETARRWNGAMLTTCPNCLHVFDQPSSSSCCASRPPVAAQSQGSPPPRSPPPSDVSASSVRSQQQQQQHEAAAAATLAAVAAPSTMLVSATLQLPPSAVPTTCTLAVTAAAPQPLRAFAGMAGGGIVLQQNPPPLETLGSKATDPLSSGSTSPGILPQPSPSAPLSFVLPTVPTLAGAAPGTPRPLNLLPFQWTLPGQSWGLPAPSVVPSLHVNLQMPTLSLSTTPPMSQSTTPPPAPALQSDTDLVRLAATLNALRTSGWYYEGLSWQESSEALQSTAPGTFLVRDSSDPRFLFSLSVQTERGPTSIRLHYVCGSFRLDAEPRLAPLMPLFDCVVKLVEHYVEATRNRSQNKAPRDKEQVWVDARGQMYSHILLRSPLYKKQQLPSLQHLARLAINRQLRAAGRVGAEAAAAVAQLPLPSPLQAYVREYPNLY